MATNKSNGTKSAFLVLDGKTNKQISIPLKMQEKILAPIVELRDWISKRLRTAPNPAQVQIGGEINYFIYPKQAIDGKEIQTTIDPATGKETSASMYGDATSATYGYIAPTSGQKLLKDTLELLGGKFIKHLFSKKDLSTDGLAQMVALFTADWTADQAEKTLMALKVAYVNSFGTMGKWATDAGHTLPTTGDGVRVKAETFTTGKDAVNAIKKVLKYKSKLGAKGGVEVDYPFARGINLSNSTLITISAEINDMIATELENSQSGFLSGVIINKETGMVKGISYLGKVIPVDVLDDIPAKGGKAVNFMVEEIGKHGAIAMPNIFKANTGLLRPHYEGQSQLGVILEGIGITQGFKAFQPELNFMSTMA